MSGQMLFEDLYSIVKVLQCPKHTGKMSQVL